MKRSSKTQIFFYPLNVKVSHLITLCDASLPQHDKLGGKTLRALRKNLAPLRLNTQTS